VRYLLVGLGNLGSRRRTILGARCVAAVDPFAPAADYRRPEDCDPGAYDAAVLSVPNAVKLGLARWFVERGKHVLVDKPLLFPDDEAVQALADAARATGAVWYTSYNHRFEPLVQEAKRRIDGGCLGRLYHVRMLYGNGTVGNVVGSWRENGLGVVEDLGTHLLDLSAHLFGYGGADFLPVVVNRHESSAPDQALLRSADGRLVLEASFVCWKNSFAVEAWGERGSLHLHGLRKWGPVELVLRERVRPSGVPREELVTDVGPDDTWLADFAHFEERVAAGCSSAANDRWISRVLRTIDP